jgi:hypothetical protein
MMKRNGVRTTAVVAVGVLLVCALAAVALERRRHAEATYDAKLVVQPLPPCGIEAVIATFRTERKPSVGPLETPMYASLDPTDREEWDGVLGTLSVVSDGGTGPVKRAVFSDGDRSLELASYNALAPPGGEVLC